MLVSAPLFTECFALLFQLGFIALISGTVYVLLRGEDTFIGKLEPSSLCFHNSFNILRVLRLQNYPDPEHTNSVADPDLGSVPFVPRDQGSVMFFFPDPGSNHYF